MESKYTPGPWFAIEYAGSFDIQSEDSYSETNVMYRDHNPLAEANAKLAASAPELLEALIKINESIDLYWNNGRTDKQAKAICNQQKMCAEAILKATSI